jgi:tRNA-2-methylthio-N6-dimethylallyladenosine synthase
MKFYTLTFGCQMNVYDSGRIERYLMAAGHVPELSEEEADLILINTCSIRDSAESRVYGTLGRIAHCKKDHPGRLVAVVGCMAQKEGEKLLKKSRIVDIIAGTYAIPRLPALVEQAALGLGPLVDVGRTPETLFDSPENFTGELIPGGIHRYPVFLSIQQGCSKVCSYCVVPYTRGQEVCRADQDILFEARALAERGYREITLIGQNVDSWRYEGLDFADLLRRIVQIDGLERIRFTTSHPADMTHKLIDTIGELDKVCESFHFPLQSGSNRVLEAMRRGYTVEEYFEKLAWIEKTFGARQSHPFAYGISTDLMVGFANETDDEFEETLECVRQASWDSAYMFKYSKRERTSAYYWVDNITEEVKNERLARLIELQELVGLALNREVVGQSVSVLIEGRPGHDPEHPIACIKGRTRTNKVVSISLPEDEQSIPEVGEVIEVTIVDCKPVTLLGELIPQSVLGCSS